MSKKIEFEESSGNVFADLGVPEPEEALLKADLAIRISKLIEERGLTQKQAAQLLGITQPYVSKLTRGQLSGFSIERLLRFLLALNQEIDVVVQPQSNPARPRRIQLVLLGSNEEAPARKKRA